MRQHKIWRVVLAYPTFILVYIYIYGQKFDDLLSEIPTRPYVYQRSDENQSMFLKSNSYGLSTLMSKIRPMCRQILGLDFLVYCFLTPNSYPCMLLLKLEGHENMSWERHIEGLRMGEDPLITMCEVLKGFP